MERLYPTWCKFAIPIKHYYFANEKSNLFKFGFNTKEILCDWFLRKNDETFEEIFPGKVDIQLIYSKAFQVYNKVSFFGKKFNLKIKRKKDQYQLIIILGALNSNKLLVKRIEAELQKKVKQIYFNEKELNIKDEVSIASLGITDGSTLLIITEEKEN